MALQNPLLPVSNPSSDAIPAPADNALTGADIQRLRHSLDNSVSQNTRKMYAPPGAPSWPGPDPAGRWPYQPHLRW